MSIASPAYEFARPSDRVLDAPGRPPEPRSGTSEAGRSGRLDLQERLGLTRRLHVLPG